MARMLTIPGGCCLQETRTCAVSCGQQGKQAAHHDVSGGLLAMERHDIAHPTAAEPKQNHTGPGGLRPGRDDDEVVFPVYPDDLLACAGVLPSSWRTNAGFCVRRHTDGPGPVDIGCVRKYQHAQPSRALQHNVELSAVVDITRSPHPWAQRNTSRSGQGGGTASQSEDGGYSTLDKARIFGRWEGLRG